MTKILDVCIVVVISEQIFMWDFGRKIYLNFQ
jgi:hypothetical protein